MDGKNLFDLPEVPQGEEISETLLSTPTLRIEKIVSRGHASPEGFWYDQPEDEWVALLQGEATIAWEDGRTRKLVAGDWLLIPAHERHRVESTSEEPPCVWLVVRGELGE